MRNVEKLRQNAKNTIPLLDSLVYETECDCTFTTATPRPRASAKVSTEVTVVAIVVFKSGSRVANGRKIELQKIKDLIKSCRQSALGKFLAKCC